MNAQIFMLRRYGKKKAFSIMVQAFSRQNLATRKENTLQYGSSFGFKRRSIL